MRSFDFDIVTDVWGQSLSPGNEQLEFWGSRAADQPGSRQHRRHQESGDRRTDPEGHLRQGSRHAGRRDQGAGPRAAVESLCGAAVHLRLCPLRPLGPLQPRRTAAEIWRLRPSLAMVVGRGEGGEDRRTHLIEQIEDAIALAAGRAGHRRRRGARGPRADAALAQDKDKAGSARHLRLRRPEVSGRLQAFRLRQSGRAEGRHVLADRPDAGSSTRTF